MAINRADIRQIRALFGAAMAGTRFQNVGEHIFLSYVCILVEMISVIVYECAVVGLVGKPIYRQLSFPSTGLAFRHFQKPDVGLPTPWSLSLPHETCCIE